MTTLARLCLAASVAACLHAFPVIAAATDADAAHAEAPFVVETWNTDRGLFQNLVISIAQSADGYLWLAYHHGWVSSFDGARFEHYTPADTPALAGSSVHRVFTDSAGDLWASIVGGGLAKRQDGEFRRLRKGTLDVSGNLEIVLNLIHERGGQLVFSENVGGPQYRLLSGRSDHATNWLWQSLTLPNTEVALFAASEEGRILYRVGSDQIGCWKDGETSLMPRDKFPPGRVRWFSTDPQGQVWVGTDSGLARLHDGLFEDMTPTNGETTVAVLKAEATKDGSLWVLTPERLRKCQDRRWTVEARIDELPSLARSPSLQLYSDRNGGAWLVDRHKGVWAVAPDGQAWKLGVEHGLPAESIECWFQDREGNVWLGLYGGGLARLRPRHFQVARPGALGPENTIGSVCEDSAMRIWLGSVSGTAWRQENGQFERVASPQLGQPAHHLKVWPGTEGSVWIGSENDGAWTVHESDYKRPFSPEAIGKSVLAGMTASNGDTWIANEFGLYRFTGDQLRAFGPSDLTTADRFLALAEDPRGAIWIGTINGRLWRYDGTRFEKFELPTDQPRFRFWSLLADTDGSVWVGTMGGGLLCWRDGILRRIAAEQGLPNTTILQLLVDDRGRLWAGTRSGLFSVGISELYQMLDGRKTAVDCRVFTTADGLPSSEFTGEHQPACWKAHDGRLWFTTLKGAVAFHPNDLQPKTLAPRVRIEEIRLDGRKWMGGRERLPSERVKVAAGRHYLDFFVTAPTFVSPERVRFRWQLEGLEPDWREAINERVIKYSFLPPGDYVFRVKACNSDGYWSEQPASFAFSVLPHFWQTATFRYGAPAAGAALLSLVGISVLRRRHRVQLERLEQQTLLEQERAKLAQERLAHQRALEGERARIASDLHDDLGASLSQMAWLGETTSHSAEFDRHPRDFLNQMTVRAREMVRAIDEIVWALNPRNDSLDQLATYVCQFAEQFFANTPTRCRFDVADPLPGVMLKSDTRHHLFLMLKEALQNVVKHAAAREVWVRIHDHEGRVLFKIEDDGCGFDRNAVSPGDGLGNMGRRATAIGATLRLHSAPGEGTCVAVELDLKSSCAQNYPLG